VSDASSSTGRSWRATVPGLSQFAVEHLLLLPLGAAVAFVWVNLWPESYFRATFAIAFGVNAVAMTFFFALMTKEVIEATAPNGVLHPWRRAWLPIIAALVASAVTAGFYGYVVTWLEEPMLRMAWPVSCATDIAVAYLLARLIFPRHPAVPFLLLLAIASDVLGFLGLAVTNPVENSRLFTGSLMLAAAIAVAFGLRRIGLRSFWPYVLVAGPLSWFALYWAGLHPALALVPVMPFLPHAARDPGFFVDAKPTARDALSRFEIWWKYPVQVTLFFFGLVNAGVPLQALELGTLGLPIAAIVGKPLGVLLGVAVALGLGLHLPARVGWRELVVAGLIAAVGFSIALFLSSAIFPPGQLRSETNMGALLALAAAPLALAMARLLGVGRFSRDKGEASH
jgi:NhaA family Na+:H+ antiporter